MIAHRFTVGQRVEFAPSRYDAGAATRGTFTIVRLLPNDGSDREYRVKDVQDGHERVARESQLIGAAPSPFH